MKRIISTTKCLLTLALMAVLVSGCGDAKKDEDKNNDSGKAGHSDGHGHHHAHVHGPNGGETFDLSDFGVRGEWKANYSQNYVTIYTLSPEGKIGSAAEKAIKATMVGTVKVGDETKTFEFKPAANPEGTASRYTCEGEDICIAMKNTGITLDVDVEGKKKTLKLDKDPH